MSQFDDQGRPEVPPPTGEFGSPPASDVTASAASATPPVETSAPAVGYAEPAIALEAPAAHKEFFTLLFCCTALFVGTVALPIEGRHLDLYAKDSISGGFLAAFSAYGILSGWLNVDRGRQIIWPAFLAAADGIYLCTMRALQLTSLEPQPTDFRAWIHLFGSGFYVIAFASLLVIWTLITAVMSGAKKDAQRKAEAKAARSARK